MKKILFVINSLTIGGSEKSLVSLLNLIDFTKFEVDLMMLRKGGEFDIYIPENVNILDEPEYYKYLAKNRENISLNTAIGYKLCRIKTTVNLRTNLKTNRIHNEQVLYKSQREILPNLEQEYDVAIAYSQGMPTYYVVDKVFAKKKIAWINCDYVNTSYDKEFDKYYYKQIDKIVVVSNSVKESISKIIPEYTQKLELILDIVNPKLIEKMASEEKVLFKEKPLIKILTVGRLITHHKGYDTAIKAAKLLKENNYKFKWFVVGEGRDRRELETLSQKMGVSDEFILLGKKENPYPYMKQCDIYVQPSKKEGFGLTVVEAKILKKPIVCTNFNTAKELINNEVDGLIVGMSGEDVFQGIKRLIDDSKFKNEILRELFSTNAYSSVKEINKIYKLIG